MLYFQSQGQKVSDMSQVDVAKNLAVWFRSNATKLNTKTQITNPMSRIDYVIDLTKEYRNMLLWNRCNSRYNRNAVYIE
ncbi:hypothetical protein [Lachnobacterium bovis]|uniref:hypothetical protein n=1 Tax=Lachnobacterium bovis TaxID=140626 RepID=UPI0018659E30|nr:hypothetical protein [Lachnobacterium bovis]